MRVSVCIPTYERPRLAEEAIQSCLSQHMLPFEILVGDDSNDNRTAQVVEKYTGHDDVRVRYNHNRSSLGQAKNVDQLFQRAQGDKIVLLHDDDLLLPSALERLVSCFEATDAHVVAAYGKQKVVANDGQMLTNITRGINEDYYRSKEFEGLQPSSIRAAVTQQFPNDGYMVEAEVAKDIGYDAKAGDACDFAFGLNLAEHGGFYFRDAYTSVYRRTEESIGRGEESGDAAYFAFARVTELPGPVQKDKYVRRWLKKRSPVAVMTAAQEGKVKEGFRWFWGPHHRHRIFSLGGARRLVALLQAALT